MAAPQAEMSLETNGPELGKYTVPSSAKNQDLYYLDLAGTGAGSGHGFGIGVSTVSGTIKSFDAGQKPYDSCLAGGEGPRGRGLWPLGLPC